MASSNDPSPSHSVVTAGPIVLAHVPIPMPPINCLAKVLRRQILLIDHLGTNLSVDQYQERYIE